MIKITGKLETKTVGENTVYLVKFIADNNIPTRISYNLDNKELAERLINAIDDGVICDRIAVVEDVFGEKFTSFFMTKILDNSLEESLTKLGF